MKKATKEQVELLKKMYVDQKMSASKIRGALDWIPNRDSRLGDLWIRRVLKVNGVVLRTSSEANVMRTVKRKPASKKPVTYMPYVEEDLLWDEWR